jgi:hypothetical protein
VSSTPGVSPSDATTALRLDLVSAQGAVGDRELSSAPVVVLELGTERLEGGSMPVELLDWLLSPARLSIAVLVESIEPRAYSAALACDVVVMTTSATLLLASQDVLGLGAGVQQRLVQRVGASGALILRLADDPIPAAEALNRGLVDLVVPDDRLDDVVGGMARKAVEHGRGSMAEFKALLAIASGEVHEAAGGQRLRRLEADATQRLDPDAAGEPD